MVADGKVGQMNDVIVLIATVLAVTACAASAVRPSAAEFVERDRWVAACFPELPVQQPEFAGELLVQERYDQVIRNTFCDGRFSIGGKTYYRGLLAHANSRIVVRLPGRAQEFRALAGVDTNFMTRGGQGSVVFTVEADGEVLFESPVLREGGAPYPVAVSLGGATEFTIGVNDSGDGISCDQGVWAEAMVALEDGRMLSLSEMPISEGQDGPPIAEGLPFSFVYGGRPSSELLPGWDREVASAVLEDGSIAYTVTLTDPETALALRCEAVYFVDFPTIEWTVWLENAGQSDTPLIEDLQGIDTVLQRHGDPNGLGEFTLHHYLGEGIGPRSLLHEAIEMKPGASRRYAPPGGRGTDHEWPYYSIESWTRSVVLGVGWPAQWAATFERDDDVGLRVRAGQELTRLVLRPGERIRTPRIVLQFYDGDPARAQSIWRGWMLAHNVPKPDGSVPPPLALAGSNRQLGEMVGANEENQKEFIDLYLQRGIHIDYWWMDAGWYVGAAQNNWPFVGTWEVDRDRFPRGLRAVTDYAHERGLKTVVWFEPERVHPGTWLYEQHPEWLFTAPGDPNGQKLLNLGIPEAREWLTDHVDRVITDEGIDLYRQDFNMDPLGYWRAADAEDRQGIAENLHVQGYLAYWDALRERHPDMLIDTCASGGRRMDLESLRRSVPLWRSDHAYEVIGNQCLTYGLSQWVPYWGTGNTGYAGSYHGSGATPVVAYDFWSTVAPAMVVGVDVRADEFDYSAFNALCQQREAIVDCFYGDFYPLSPPSVESSAWLAWQFHLPEADRGTVMVFRRGDSPYLAVRYALRGLDPDASYRLTLLGQKGDWVQTGEELLQRGVRIDLDNTPDAAVIAYEKE